MLIGEIAALITAVLWSGSAIAFSEASKQIGSSLVNITRMVIGLFFLAITILLLDINTNISLNQYYYLIISGIIGIAFGDAFLFKALEMIGARISMLLMAVSPIIAAVLAFLFLGENISFWGVIGIIITFTGILLVLLQKSEATNRDKNSVVGIVFALLAALGQGGGLIFAKLAFNNGEINGFFATFIRLAAAFIVFYPILRFSNRLNNPIEKLKKNKKGFVFSSIGAFIGPYLGITMSLIAVKHAYVGIASTLMSTVPVIMLPIVYFYYKEKLSLSSILGAFITVLGISVLFLKN
ncbi:MAG TPA: DMT family transporter [Melioribacteraceae bacterium]|nr:DMT family transporter [Melioribacteraceae bacterium]